MFNFAETRIKCHKSKFLENQARDEICIEPVVKPEQRLHRLVTEKNHLCLVHQNVVWNERKMLQAPYPVSSVRHSAFCLFIKQ